MIQLRKMTESEFQSYLKRAIPTFASEKMKAENLSALEAEVLAQKSFQSLLPQGLLSEGQFFFSIVKEACDSAIGMLWFAQKISDNLKQAFIYDFEIQESFRGKGFGKEALRLVEYEVKALGLSSVGLHVFGHNTNAIALYRSSGFRETNIVMIKDL